MAEHRKSPRARSLATLRCAIYTRKSSEEGLEQDFNSLQALAPEPNCCGARKVKIFSRPTSLYCATSCNRHGKQKSALVEPQCFPPLRLST